MRSKPVEPSQAEDDFVTPAGECCAWKEMNIQLTNEEIENHLHPLSPMPGESQMVSLLYRIDPNGQTVTEIEIGLVSGNSEVKRHLRFLDIWLNSFPGELAIPEPVGGGILIVDIKDRGWIHPLAITADDDERRVIFGAGRIEEA